MEIQQLIVAIPIGQNVLLTANNPAAVSVVGRVCVEALDHRSGRNRFRRENQDRTLSGVLRGCVGRSPRAVVAFYEAKGSQSELQRGLVS